MNVHQNARLTPLSREHMVHCVIEQGLSVQEAAKCFRVSMRTVYKWLARYRLEGASGLADRNSRPKHHPRALCAHQTSQIEALRRHRYTGYQIATQVGVSPATVSRVLQRLGLNRLSSLEPVAPVRRYERDLPGELIHLDIKQLARFEQPGSRVTGNRKQVSRGAGWEYAHVAIDDCSRVAYARIHPNQQARSAVRFLTAVVAYFKGLGVRCQRVMTDNGPCYRSRAFAHACRRLGLKHLFTRPYTPQTNGKAERFIQTALREWAYAIAYASSLARAAELPRWLHRYNWHRPHTSLQYRVPLSRLGLPLNNLLMLHN